jgi:hypothetical protein
MSTLFTPLLPRELWWKIFQLATFIRGELDIPSTMIRPDLFAVWDGLQPLAWQKILPSRVAIQSVSRSWHSIGMELLYRSFHHYEPAKVRLFARRLCAQPSYGVHVKRLSLRCTNEVMSAAVKTAQTCSFTAQLSSTIRLRWGGTHTYIRHPFDTLMRTLTIFPYGVSSPRSHNVQIWRYWHYTGLRRRQNRHQLLPGLFPFQGFGCFGSIAPRTLNHAPQSLKEYSLL